MTRLEQYLLRRERYRSRRTRWYRAGWHWTPFEVAPGVFIRRRFIRYRPLLRGPLQYKGHLRPAYPTADLTRVAAADFVDWKVTKPGKGRYPRVLFIGATRAFLDLNPGFRFRLEQTGYYCKRYHAIGKRPWRMTGQERRMWGAGKCAKYNGFFPDWDPLGRHPTLEDLLHGADAYTGPFPGVPGRLNTPA